jgi:hypothetical protein
MLVSTKNNGPSDLHQLGFSMNRTNRKELYFAVIDRTKKLPRYGVQNDFREKRQ